MLQILNLQRCKFSICLSPGVILCCHFHHQNTLNTYLPERVKHFTPVLLASHQQKTRESLPTRSAREQQPTPVCVLPLLPESVRYLCYPTALVTSVTRLRALPEPPLDSQ